MPEEAPAGGRFLFASESVTEGHPDKLCDRVADAVLDACLAQDPDARVVCEACTKAGMVMVLGELVTKASVNYEQVIREAVKLVGLDSDDKGLDWRTMNVINAMEEQSPDIVQAIAAGKAPEDAGTGEQGIAFGYASDESPEMMPLSHLLATRLCAQLDKARKDGSIQWACPDGKAQVTVEYTEATDGAVVPARIHSVVVSTRQAADVTMEQRQREVMDLVVKPVLPEELCDSSTTCSITEAKQALGSARGDTGLSGRKGAADTYGGWGPSGNTSISGKDGLRIGRSATYGARWAARSLVSARLCKRCLVQLSYAPGSPRPSSVHVHSYGTAKSCGKTDAELTAVLQKNFDFRLGCLQRDLGLKAPRWQKLAAYGHFGRRDVDLPWEKPKELH